MPQKPWEKYQAPAESGPWAKYAAPSNGGLLEPGTITNLYSRPVLKNPDGSYSTTVSTSFNDDGKEVLIPTVVNGKRLTFDQAVAHYRQSGEHLGKFDTPANADAYATKLHEEQARRGAGTVAALDAQAKKFPTAGESSTSKPGTAVMGEDFMGGWEKAGNSLLNAFEGAGVHISPNRSEIAPQTLTNFAKGVAQTGETLSKLDPMNPRDVKLEGARGLVDMAKGGVAPFVQAGQGAISGNGQEFREGLSKAVGMLGIGEALNPSGGPSVTEAAEATAAAARAAKKIPGKVADLMSGKAFTPEGQIVQAIKPTAANRQFKTTLERSLPEIKKSEAALGKPIETAEEMLDATIDAKKRVRAELDTLAGPARAKFQSMDATKVRDAIKKSVSAKTRRQNPALADKIDTIAETYGDKFTLEELEDFLKTTNAELEGHYAKYPTKQRKAVASDPEVAHLDAEAQTLRDVIYEAIDSVGTGAAPRELQRRYGSLLNMEHELYRRINVAERQQPLSLSEQISRWHAVGSGVGAIGGAFFGGGPAGAGIGSALGTIGGGIAEAATASWLKSRLTTDALIKSAFEGYGKKPGAINFTPPVTRPVKGLIAGKAPIITPAPPNPSYARGVPANPQRLALPSAPTNVPVTGTVQRSSGVTYPMRAPVSGLLPQAASPVPQGRMLGATAITNDPGLPPVPDPSGVTAMNAGTATGYHPQTGQSFQYFTAGEQPPQNAYMERGGQTLGSVLGPDIEQYLKEGAAKSAIERRKTVRRAQEVGGKITREGKITRIDK